MSIAEEPLNRTLTLDDDSSTQAAIQDRNAVIVPVLR